ncbi:hypothetical protein [Myxococcus sp. AB025B]|uniref:hypothetical protein n=1 Tax=Myxococcus sp. AB025B TaxID=2562794 RepID=UPI001E4E1E59|nr:hypothetical protein [Myxococcus sp. AB025B]
MPQENDRRMGEDGAHVTPPESSPSRPPPQAFVRALREMEPRSAAVLTRRLVTGASLGDCARFYGVTDEALSVMLLRAAVSLTRNVFPGAREPATAEEESAWARMLAAALEREDAPVPAGLVPVVEACRRLRALSGDVTAGLEAATREDQASPQRRREDWLRRLAVMALLALTAYLYLSRPEEPARRPSTAPQPSAPDSGRP